MKRLVILDRDGVINFDSSDFIKSPEEWTAIPGSLPAIKRLNDAGFIVCVATNQSGVGRGLFTIETLNQIHDKMTKQLAALGGKIDNIVYCPHKPEDNCACRKPKSEMIRRLMNQYHTPPENTWVIGDALRDLQAGEAEGCQTILVRTGKGEDTLREHSELNQGLFFDNLEEAVNFLINLSSP
jgi:D-glycero-D-manno-heptose 1,7-bisphosphate phosphatase